jgi:hypothetical protein
MIHTLFLFLHTLLGNGWNCFRALSMLSQWNSYKTFSFPKWPRATCCLRATGWAGQETRLRGWTVRSSNYCRDKRYLFSPEHPDCLMGLTSLLFNVYWGYFPEIKNEWSYISTPPAWLYSVYRVNLKLFKDLKSKKIKLNHDPNWNSKLLKLENRKPTQWSNTDGYQGTRIVTSGKESHYETKCWQNGHQGKWHKPSSTSTSHAIVCYKKVWTRYEIFMCTPTNFNGDFFLTVTTFLPCHIGEVRLVNSFQIDDSAMTCKITHVLSTPS